MKAKLQKLFIRVSKHTIYALILQCSFFIVARSENSEAQHKKLNEIQVEMTPGQKSFFSLLSEIEQSTDFLFAYTKKEVVNKTVVLPKQQWDMDELLTEVSLQTSLFFKRVNNIITVRHKKNKKDLPVVIDVLRFKFTVSGQVTDENGGSLPGVSILEKGTTNGAITDADGKYQLEVSDENAVLIFSFVGYLQEEVDVSGRSQIDIAMLPDIKSLEEIVVVGYGTQKEANLTYSVAKVDADELRNRPIGRLDEAMQGQLAGVTIRQSNGTPGTAPSILVRGVNSINAGSGPLYVIDGMPVDDANIVGNLNLASVESIEVLKDAAAAAIYGSRGAGGVVIITTKKGEKGKIQVSYSGYAGVQQAEKVVDVLSGPEQIAYIIEAREDGYANFLANNPDEVFNPDPAARPSNYTYNPEWANDNTSFDHVDDFFQNGRIQGHQISMGGGTDRSSFFASVDYFNQNGIVEGTGFERISTRMNASYQLNDRIEIGTNVEYGYSVKQETQSHGKGNALDHILAHASFAPLDIRRTGNPGGYTDSEIAYYNAFNLSLEGSRSLDRAELIDDNAKRGQILSNTFLNVNILEGLDFRTSIGLVYISSDRRKFNPGNNWDNIRGERWTSTSFNWLSESIVEYAKSFDKHNLSVLVGYSSQKQTSESSFMRGVGFANGVIPTLNAAASIDRFGNGVGEWGLVSYLARAMYDFNGRYLLTASIRRDGSSRFGTGSKWGIFPSASVGWRISEESFFNVPVISDLKFKASWGQTGNNQIGDFDQFGVLRPVTAALGGEITGGFAYNPGRVSNPSLRWEKNTAINAGFDIALIENRIQLGFDYYKNTTSDLLLSVPLPTISGFSGGRQNVGEVVNQGFDIEITSRNIARENLSWTTTLVFNANDNEVTRMNAEDARILTGPGYARNNITRVGDPIGALYMYEADGVYNDQAELDAHGVTYSGALPARPGDLKIVDQNNDGVIDLDDRVVVGQPMAKYNFGFNNQVEFKNFDLRVFITGSGGNVIYNANGREGGNVSRSHINKYAYFNDRWTVSNPNGNTPRASAFPTGYSDGNAFETTLDVFDGDFWRVKNLTLGYTLPAGMLRDFVSSVRFYFSGENLFLNTRYIGFNPEANSPREAAASAINGAGMDYASFPNARTYTLGLNVSF